MTNVQWTFLNVQSKKWSSKILSWKYLFIGLVITWNIGIFSNVWKVVIENFYVSLFCQFSWNFSVIGQRRFYLLGTKTCLAENEKMIRRVHIIDIYGPQSLIFGVLQNWFDILLVKSSQSSPTNRVGHEELVCQRLLKGISERRRSLHNSV